MAGTCKESTFSFFASCEPLKYIAASVTIVIKYNSENFLADILRRAFRQAPLILVKETFSMLQVDVS